MSVDTLRADRLGAYGYGAARTPAIDALAARGVLFERAYSPVPITLPAHATMLTGLGPPTHGVRDNGAFQLRPEFETLAERFRARGYATGAFLGGVPLERSRGLDQGFDRYDDKMPIRSFGALAQAARAERQATEVLDAASVWIGGIEPGRPYFAFVHLYDPHAPYVQAVPGESKADYDGEIAYVDRELGRFLAGLDAAGRRPRLTILTSDHGEGLGEHREETHCLFAYDSTLRVPWIVHWPGELAPRRIAAPVGLVDLAPTLLELAGDGRSWPPPANADGVSQAAAVRGRAPVEERDLYFESRFGELRFGWAPLRGLRRGRWKLIELPRRELFDVETDPGELANRAAEGPPEGEALARRLAAIPDGRRAEAPGDAEDVRRLASLGYVQAPPLAGDRRSEAADPKDRIDAYERFQRAHLLALEGRLEETLEIFATLEPALSSSPYFYVEWGNFAAAAERWELSASLYGRCLALDPGHADALLNLGVAYLRTGRPAEARARFEALVAVAPDHVQARLFAGVVAHNAFRDAAAARRHWRRFLELAPTHPESEKIRRALAALDAAR